ncbi:MAG: roadblock/LC7 domain-containing protein [Gemmatimonadetes bacterium]|nr:roadblock/LC7 domain-containing protein [Gemmatimonadota bacterium]
MKQPSADDLRRWSEEFARNPDTLAFIPLAEAYRRQGRQDDALRICLRGLERHPSNVEAHAVLARIYLARSDKDKAFDEWLLISKLDPEHFETRRGLGFGYLERGNMEQAVWHLTKAAELRPDDETVREALAFARQQLESAGASEAQATEAAAHRAAGAAGTRTEAERTPVGGARPATSSGPAGGSAEPIAPTGSSAAALSPDRLFAGLLASPVLLGIVLLDADGLLLAGGMRDVGPDGAEAVASVLSGTIDEATRTVEHLGLGAWEGILLETEEAKAYLQPVGDALLLVAGQARAPAGWLKRVAGEAREVAAAFLGGGNG